MRFISSVNQTEESAVPPILLLYKPRALAPAEQSGRNVKQSTYLYVIPVLRKSGVILPLSSYDLMAHIRTALFEQGSTQQAFS